MSIVDAQGYRLNVGIILRNHDGHLLLARRSDKHSWQFPQGGMAPSENEEESMYRELDEELGLSRDKVSILAKSNHWYSYRLPQRFIRYNQYPECIGQKQKWFLLNFLGENEDIRLDTDDKPEFSNWAWFNPMDPLHTLVIFFKRDVYQAVLNEFAPFTLGGSIELGQSLYGGK